ncbi:Copia protein [Dufourea novaeangliae]|uniref:Copia protein n=1 Tax=Dufourea novaeangliae TaxID=178035 RepID=A0A154PLU1_DUFNO|nr:Copia protein [Dufourea novaeangliae]
MTKGPTITVKVKHIDICCHFVREVVAKGDIDIEYLPLEEMPADVFTKGLGASKHYACLSRLGLMLK